MNDENGPRKVSRSSTNQLIADVANGLAAHIEGKIFISRIEEDYTLQNIITYNCNVKLPKIPFIFRS